MAYRGEVKIGGSNTVVAAQFAKSVGRLPKNKSELEDFAHYVEKGIEAQLDWPILYSCAAENFTGPRKKGERK